MKPVISVGGVDITADVQFDTAKFTSAASGAPGPFDMYVRDTGHGYSPFNTGDEVTVDWDGNRLYGGYLRIVNRTFPFPVEPTPGFARTAPRYWHLQGTDYNTLLAQRVIYNHAQPTWGNTSASVAFQYPPLSYDDDVITDLLHNYSDLEADGITLDGINRIGVVVFDVPGVTSGKGLSKDTWPEIAAAGYYLTQALYTIARNSGGIFYITPTKSFQYVDVDTPTSAFTLTDQPRVDGDVGYRALEILFDGTRLDNDARVWGQTLGSTATVFSRVQDAASILEHGRWQSGLNTAALYRQASADAVAGSYVYGSPTSHRGGKDDRVGFTCTVFDTPFIVAQKVRCVSNVEEFDEVYPIRRIILSFPSPTSIREDISLSWEPDLPWDFAEYLKVTQKNVVISTGGGLGGGLGSGLGGGSGTCITDTFTRTVVNGWGTSDAGIPWVVYGGNIGVDFFPSVDGSRGIWTIDAYAGGTVGAGLYGLLGGSVFDVYLQGVSFNVTPTSGIHTNLGFLFGNGGFWNLNFSLISGVERWDGTDNASWATCPVSFAGPFNLRIAATDSQMQGRIWLASDPEPSTWTFTQVFSNPGFTGDAFDIQFNNDDGPMSFSLDSLDITGVPGVAGLGGNDAGISITDTFNRTTSPGTVGTADCGLVWYAIYSTGSEYCDGAQFNLAAGSTWALPIPSETSIDLTLDLTYEATPVDEQLVAQLGPDAGPRWRFNVYGLLIIAPNSGTSSGTGVSWATGAAYRTHIQIDGVGARMNVWLASNPEPSGWMVSYAYTTPVALTPIEVSNAAILGSGRVILLDNLNIVGVGTAIGGSTGGCAPTPAELSQPDGRSCEFPSTIDGYRFELASNFISGSLSVWLNGILQTLGTNYSEHPSDPSGGPADAIPYFTFFDVVPPTDTVYACYYQTVSP